MNYIEIANEFIAEGYNPLPLLQNKAPKLPKDHQFLYKPIDQIEYRFKNCDKIGIACGDVSGGFYGLDFDRHGGENLQPIFEDFVSNQYVVQLISAGQLSVYETPSGGFHFYFRCSQTFKGNTLSFWETGKVMIELRGNGQYLCVYPSGGYKHLAGNDMFSISYSEPEEIEALFSIARSYTQYLQDQEQGDGVKREWTGIWKNNSVEGQFNNEEGEQIAKDLLREAGWQLASIRRCDGVELWTRPGKNTEDGISATFGARPKMFYVFTDNAEKFQKEKAYNPFQIYTILKFDGDWKKAKDSLKPKVEIKQDEPETEIKHMEFPIDVFPEFFQEYILELKKSLNFHVDFSSAAFMFTFSTLIGNKFKLQVKKGWEAAPIFWFACVGYPGTIKTHPIKTMVNPLTVLDKESKKRYDQDMVEWNKQDKKETPKPRFKQLLISDYTVEALHSIHDINKRGIGLYKDELKGFLNDMNKYRKGSDEEFWLESFNNGSYIVNRVTKEPIMVSDICINIIGTIQYDVLNEVIRQYKGNGLIDRFLFTAAETNVYPITDAEISDEYYRVWMELCRGMDLNFSYNQMEGSELLKMDAETFKIYQEIDAEYCRIQNDEDENQAIKNYLSKMKTYVPRFALLLAIIDAVGNDGYIELEPIHMSKAKKVADYFINTAKIVFDTTDEQLDIQSVESGLKSLKKVERIYKLLEAGFKPAHLAKYFGVSRQYISKVVNQKK